MATLLQTQLTSVFVAFQAELARIFLWIRPAFTCFQNQPAATFLVLSSSFAVLADRHTFFRLNFIATVLLFLDNLAVFCELHPDQRRQGHQVDKQKAGARYEDVVVPSVRCHEETFLRLSHTQIAARIAFDPFNLPPDRHVINGARLFATRFVPKFV